MVHVKVGRFSSIGRAVIGGQGRHPTDWLSTHPAFYSLRGHSALPLCEEDMFDEEPRPVLIGSDVWIGDGAVIREGCSIGDGAIVAASAVVVKDVAPYEIVGGVPARLIRYRFSEEVIELLKNWRWWNLPEDQLRAVSRDFRRHQEWTASAIEDLIERSRPSAVQLG